MLHVSKNHSVWSQNRRVDKKSCNFEAIKISQCQMNSGILEMDESVLLESFFDRSCSFSVEMSHNFCNKELMIECFL
jgi:hypothetical protein